MRSLQHSDSDYIPANYSVRKVDHVFTLKVLSPAVNNKTL